MTRFTGGFPPDPDAPGAVLAPPTAAAGADEGPGLPIPTAAGGPEPPSSEDSISDDRNPRFASTRQQNTAREDQTTQKKNNNKPNHTLRRFPQ